MKNGTATVEHVEDANEKKINQKSLLNPLPSDSPLSIYQCICF